LIDVQEENQKGGGAGKSCREYDRGKGKGAGGLNTQKNCLKYHEDLPEEEFVKRKGKVGGRKNKADKVSGCLKNKTSCLLRKETKVKALDLQKKKTGRFQIDAGNAAPRRKGAQMKRNKYEKAPRSIVAIKVGGTYNGTRQETLTNTSRKAAIRRRGERGKRRGKQR